MAKGTIVVSLRSKGLPSFNKSLIFDVRYQAVQFATELLDVFLASFVSFACLSWTSWISVSVNIITIAATLNINDDQAAMDIPFIFFIYIVLPILILFTIVFGRRESALRSLAELKAAVVSLLLHRPQGVTVTQREASDDLQRRIVAFMDDLRQYLQHRRPYARHFYLPYRTSNPSPQDELLKISRELGLLLRKVQRGVRDLHLTAERMRECGFSEGQVSVVVAKVESMHRAMERLSNIKEMRTPVVMRAIIRWFVVVLLPVAFGPFWNAMRRLTGNAAYAGIFGVLTHIALMASVDTVVAMEDPFDDTALDAISLYEMLDQVGAMTNPPTDSDGYDASGPGDSGADGTGGGSGSGAVGAAASNGDPHVAMYMSGNGVGAGGPGTIGVPADMPAGGAGAGGGVGASASMSTSGMTSSMGAGGGGGSGTAPGMSISERSGLAQVQQAAGNGAFAIPGAGNNLVGGMGVMPIPAMRGSVTSDTAVGPPSALDGGAGGGGRGGNPNLPSVTSPAPLFELGAPVRAPPPMPPMPALAGDNMYLPAGGGGGGAAGGGGGEGL
ncbi:hypothetical protein HYH02_008171 [Chlamydomonas schloesseri]|uniref:Uncharacterized protein n=1 Tax=Chlamydomonas schloesseri TaxID=2026947 RepID=A0A835WGR0_9CHLO|nr:hypothetical protein HYH02_008171 [Chlamydomonas schloesseri]|eukprot:KAG2447018.1 hypothetical protein HYH02_008171 [Chlamydomonas schloesseri]